MSLFNEVSVILSNVKVQHVPERKITKNKDTFYVFTVYRGRWDNNLGDTIIDEWYRVYIFYPITEDVLKKIQPGTFVNIHGILMLQPIDEVNGSYKVYVKASKVIPLVTVDRDIKVESMGYLKELPDDNKKKVITWLNEQITPIDGMPGPNTNWRTKQLDIPNSENVLNNVSLINE